MATDIQAAYSYRTDGIIASMFLDFYRFPGEANLTNAGQVMPSNQAATLDRYDARWSVVSWREEVAPAIVTGIPSTATGPTTQQVDVTTYKPTRFTLLESGEAWSRLTNAAEAGDEHGFMAAIEVLDWTHQAPDAILRGVRLAIMAGAPVVARNLATEGAARHPEHAELQTAFRILAPPRVIRSDLPPNSGMASNTTWLKEHHGDYNGKWVALRNGCLLGTAESLHALIEYVGRHEDILYAVA